MKKVLILGVLLGTLVLVAFAHAQCMSGSGEMKVMCIKSGGMGGECCKTMGMDCCKMMGHHKMGGCAENCYLCCAEGLGLSDEQVKRLKVIQLEHQKSAIRMRADLEIMELELKDLLHQQAPDRSAIDDKLTAMGGLKTKMKKKHVHARLDAKSVLTKEQLEKCSHGSCGACGMGKMMIKRESCPKEGKE